MLLWLMNPIRNASRKDMIELCDLIPFQKEILSWFMIRIKIPWGDANSSCYGMALTSFLKS